MLASFVSPKLAAKLVRKQLETFLKKKVPTFDILFEPKKGEMFFIINELRYEMEADNLKSVIQEKLKGQNLDYCVISVSENDRIFVNIYQTIGEKKIKTTNEL